MEFLVFGEDWGRHPSSSQHLLQEIGEHYEVHWVNSIGLRQPSLNFKDLLRIGEKLMAAGKADTSCQPAQESPEATSMTKPTSIIKPLVWPMAQHPLARQLNSLLLKRQVSAKHSQRVVWAALPSAVDYLDICDSDLVIYYCGDDFSALAGVDHQLAADAERRLVARADIIFACSHALHAKFPADKTVLLPHGVHLSQFANATTCPVDIAPDKPSIGFYGSLNNWLDQSLIVRLAKARPNINFYFIGREDSDIASLRQHPNITLLPAKPHHQLPQYLQHWTMAILPFVDNEQIRACNPLKMREYLAAGCPVISSPFPATAPYRDLITTASSEAEWLATIDHYCQWTPQQRSNHAELAYLAVSNESWSFRATQAIDVIKQKLAI
ncbi:glycosyltransferase family 1 protein [Photobacterium rosenbergii]|uniref:Glycosyltransferase family 1 protein n=1 Tax=Photobacterium rosenbergii TaxID=294936 RepID=A0A2T3ND29_9GAMM|nr:glycosyltransferase [Photobacterium rosenbergii]PSW11958.1 glycosyltransferase family 1 protein [Photobacterium rosenbergii]